MYMNVTFEEATFAVIKVSDRPGRKLHDTAQAALDSQEEERWPWRGAGLVVEVTKQRRPAGYVTNLGVTRS